MSDETTMQAAEHEREQAIGYRDTAAERRQFPPVGQFFGGPMFSREFRGAWQDEGDGEHAENIAILAEQAAHLAGAECDALKETLGADSHLWSAMAWAIDRFNDAAYKLRSALARTEENLERELGEGRTVEEWFEIRDHHREVGCADTTRASRAAMADRIDEYAEAMKAKARRLRESVPA